MSEASWTVPGLPPVKNEAKSLLSVGHEHADRVVALLQAARAATECGGWVPTIGQSLGLELVVLAPVEPPSDLTPRTTWAEWATFRMRSHIVAS